MTGVGVFCVFIFLEVIHCLQITPPLYRELARDPVSAVVQLEVKVQLGDLAVWRNARSAGK